MALKRVAPLDPPSPELGPHCHDRGGLSVEPDPHHGAVEDQADDRLVSKRARIPAIPISFDLPPHPAHRIFADRAAKDGSQRPADPTGIGAGQIGACDQRIGLPGSPLVSPQRRALPFDRSALGGIQPSPRHRDVHATKCPDQRARSMAVPMAGDRRTGSGVLNLGLWLSAIARARQYRLELVFDHRLDEAAHPIAQTGFDRIKPVIEEPGRCVGF